MRRPSTMVHIPVNTEQIFYPDLGKTACIECKTVRNPSHLVRFNGDTQYFHARLPVSLKSPKSYSSNP